MGVQVRPVAGVVRGVLAHHERPVAGHRQQRLAQNLIGHQIPAGASRSGPDCLVDGAQRGVDHLGVELHEVGHLLAGPPASPCRNPAGRAAIRRCRRAVRPRIAQGSDGDARLGQGAQQSLEPHRASYHQWPNSSVSNAAITCAGQPIRSDSERRWRTRSTKSSTWCRPRGWPAAGRRAPCVRSRPRARSPGPACPVRWS